MKVSFVVLMFHLITKSCMSVLALSYVLIHVGYFSCSNLFYSEQLSHEFILSFICCITLTSSLTGVMSELSVNNHAIPRPGRGRLSLLSAHYHLSRDTRKLGFEVSDQVRHKPACTVSEDG